jgi:heme-degrading monooxygenase HmoA
MKRMLKSHAHHSTLLAGLSLLVGASVMACSDDKEKTPSVQQAALVCSASKLETDLEGDGFSGPGVDEATGELKLEPGKQYLVSSTYGVPVPGANGAPVTEHYLALFGAIQAQLAQQPGLLAMRLASSDGCGSGRTMAVWSSEEEMYAFVASDAHFAAMKAVGEVLKPGYGVTHWTATSAEQISWQEAVRKLAAN